ncbi:MAG: coproporphyrinogen III oxidase family protein [Acidobacteria bacterium]|nr:coproporphyrinogen III oxidase family protein [Acidobacteriota bacterium]
MNGGIYVHIPFCQSRCRYCSFYSITGRNFPDSGEYARAIISHLNSFEMMEPIDVSTIYFGGGTPSLMPASFFSEVIEGVSASVSLTENLEISIEMNPEDVVPDYLGSLKQAGINRVSIGVQSTDDSILRKLNRTHDAKQAVSAVLTARSIFTNVSCDVIIGIEGEANEGNRILKTLPFGELSHLSLYMLDGAKNNHLAAESDHTADLYMELCRQLENHGLKQYEISNFARPNMESIHNLHYWKGDPYIGLGPSGHSLLYPFRIWDHSGLDRFMKGQFRKGRMKYDKKTFVREMVMLALRLRKGARQEDFKERYGIDLLMEFGWLCSKFPGFVRCDGEGISLSRKGMLVSNEIFQELVVPAPPQSGGE